ncbi:hypothetical protein [Nocardioides sp.]|uniref:hypothetical protein n=1 Tax=Nocardioides sp. TaxID=35761 RepID=UPI00351979C6
MTRLDDVRAAIAQSSAALSEQLARGRAELDADRARPLFTDAERRELQEVAEGGAMGPRMREFADAVRRGEADWDDFVRRQDGREGLLEDLVQESQDRFGEEAARAFAASEAPEDVVDPRPRPHDPDHA